MNDVLVHLTQLAQRCGKALEIAQWDIKSFDDLFQDILAEDSDDATDVIGLLYQYSKAYCRFASVRHLSGLKNQLSEQENQELRQVKQDADNLRTALAEKIHQLEANNA